MPPLKTLRQRVNERTFSARHHSFLLDSDDYLRREEPPEDEEGPAFARWIELATLQDAYRRELNPRERRRVALDFQRVVHDDPRAFWERFDGFRVDWEWAKSSGLELELVREPETLEAA